MKATRKQIYNICDKILNEGCFAILHRLKQYNIKEPHLLIVAGEVKFGQMVEAGLNETQANELIAFSNIWNMHSMLCLDPVKELLIEGLFDYKRNDGFIEDYIYYLNRLNEEQNIKRRRIQIGYENAIKLLINNYNLILEFDFKEILNNFNKSNQQISLNSDNVFEQCEYIINEITTNNEVLKIQLPNEIKIKILKQTLRFYNIKSDNLNEILNQLFELNELEAAACIGIIIDLEAQNLNNSGVLHLLYIRFALLLIDVYDINSITSSHIIHFSDKLLDELNLLYSYNFPMKDEWMFYDLYVQKYIDLLEGEFEFEKLYHILDKHLDLNLINKQATSGLLIFKKLSLYNRWHPQEDYRILTHEYLNLIEANPTLFNEDLKEAIIIDYISNGNDIDDLEICDSNYNYALGQSDLLAKYYNFDIKQQSIDEFFLKSSTHKLSSTEYLEFFSFQKGGHLLAEINQKIKYKIIEANFELLTNNHNCYKMFLDVFKLISSCSLEISLDHFYSNFIKSLMYKSDVSIEDITTVLNAGLYYSVSTFISSKNTQIGRDSLNAEINIYLLNLIELEKTIQLDPFNYPIKKLIWNLLHFIKDFNNKLYNLYYSHKVDYAINFHKFNNSLFEYFILNKIDRVNTISKEIDIIRSKFIPDVEKLTKVEDKINTLRENTILFYNFSILPNKTMSIILCLCEGIIYVDEICDITNLGNMIGSNPHLDINQMSEDKYTKIVDEIINLFKPVFANSNFINNEKLHLIKFGVFQKTPIENILKQYFPELANVHITLVSENSHSNGTIAVENILIVKPSYVGTWKINDDDEIYKLTEYFLNNSIEYKIFDCSVKSKEDLFYELCKGYYNIIHFIGHGFYDDNLSIESPCIVLSDSNPEFTLSYLEITNYKIDTSMVVLSLCNGYSGNSENASAILSIGNAFLKNDVSYVLSSNTEVKDELTALIMVKFYENLAEFYYPQHALEVTKTYFKNNPKYEKEIEKWEVYI